MRVRSNFLSNHKLGGMLGWAVVALTNNYLGLSTIWRNADEIGVRIYHQPRLVMRVFWDNDRVLLLPQTIGDVIDESLWDNEQTLLAISASINSRWWYYEGESTRQRAPRHVSFNHQRSVICSSAIYYTASRSLLDDWREGRQSARMTVVIPGHSFIMEELRHGGRAVCCGRWSFSAIVSPWKNYGKADQLCIITVFISRHGIYWSINSLNSHISWT